MREVCARQLEDSRRQRSTRFPFAAVANGLGAGYGIIVWSGEVILGVVSRDQIQGWVRTKYKTNKKYARWARGLGGEGRNVMGHEEWIIHELLIFTS